MIPLGEKIYRRKTVKKKNTSNGKQKILEKEDTCFIKVQRSEH